MKEESKKEEGNNSIDNTTKEKQIEEKKEKEKVKGKEVKSPPMTNTSDLKLKWMIEDHRNKLRLKKEMGVPPEISERTMKEVKNLGEKSKTVFKRLPTANLQDMNKIVGVIEKEHYGAKLDVGEEPIKILGFIDVLNALSVDGDSLEYIVSLLQMWCTNNKGEIVAEKFMLLVKNFWRILEDSDAEEGFMSFVQLAIANDKIEMKLLAPALAVITKRNIEASAYIAQQWLNKRQPLLSLADLAQAISACDSDYVQGCRIIAEQWLQQQKQQQQPLSLEDLIKAIDCSVGNYESGCHVISRQWWLQQSLLSIASLQEFIKELKKFEKYAKQYENGCRVVAEQYVRQCCRDMSFLTTLTDVQPFNIVGIEGKLEDYPFVWRTIVREWLKSRSIEQLRDFIYGLKISKEIEFPSIGVAELFDKLIVEEISTRNLVGDEGFDEGLSELKKLKWMELPSRIVPGGADKGLGTLYKDVTRDVMINGSSFVGNVGKELKQDKTEEELCEQELKQRGLNNKQINQLKNYSQMPSIAAGHVSHGPIYKHILQFQEKNKQSIFFNIVENNTQQFFQVELITVEATGFKTDELHNEGDGVYLQTSAHYMVPISTTTKDGLQLNLSVPIWLDVSGTYLFGDEGPRLVGYTTADPLTFCMLTTKSSEIDKRREIIEGIVKDIENKVKSPDFARIFLAQYGRTMLDGHKKPNVRTLLSKDVGITWREYLKFPPYRTTIVENFGKIFQEIKARDQSAAIAFLQMFVDIPTAEEEAWKEQKNKDKTEDKTFVWGDLLCDENFLGFLRGNADLFTKNQPSSAIDLSTEQSLQLCINTIIEEGVGCKFIVDVINKLTEEAKKLKEQKKLEISEKPEKPEKLQQSEKKQEPGALPEVIKLIQALFPLCSATDLYGLFKSVSDVAVKKEILSLLFLKYKNDPEKKNRMTKFLSYFLVQDLNDKGNLEAISLWLRSMSNADLGALIYKLKVSGELKFSDENFTKMIRELVVKEVSTRNLVDDENFKLHLKGMYKEVLNQPGASKINTDTMVVLPFGTTPTLEQLYKDWTRDLRINKKILNLRKLYNGGEVEQWLKEQGFSEENIELLQNYSQNPSYITNSFGKVIGDALYGMPVSLNNQDGKLQLQSMDPNVLAENGIYRDNNDNKIHLKQFSSYCVSMMAENSKISLPVWLDVAGEYDFVKGGLKFYRYTTTDPLVFLALTSLPQGEVYKKTVDAVITNLSEQVKNPDFARVFLAQYQSVQNIYCDTRDVSGNLLQHGVSALFEKFVNDFGTAQGMWVDYLKVSSYRATIFQKFSEIFKAIKLKNADVATVFMRMFAYIISAQDLQELFKSIGDIAVKEKMLDVLLEEKGKVVGNETSVVADFFSNFGAQDLCNVLKIAKKDEEKSKKIFSYVLSKKYGDTMKNLAQKLLSFLKEAFDKKALSSDAVTEICVRYLKLYETEMYDGNKLKSEYGEVGRLFVECQDEQKQRLKFGEGTLSKLTIIENYTSASGGDSLAVRQVVNINKAESNEIELTNEKKEEKKPSDQGKSTNKSLMDLMKENYIETEIEKKFPVKTFLEAVKKETTQQKREEISQEYFKSQLKLSLGDLVQIISDLGNEQVNVLLKECVGADVGGKMQQSQLQLPPQKVYDSVLYACCEKFVKERNGEKITLQEIKEIVNNDDPSPARVKTFLDVCNAYNKYVNNPSSQIGFGAQVKEFLEDRSLLMFTEKSLKNVLYKSLSFTGKPSTSKMTQQILEQCETDSQIKQKK